MTAIRSPGRGEGGEKGRSRGGGKGGKKEEKPPTRRPRAANTASFAASRPAIDGAWRIWRDLQHHTGGKGRPCGEGRGEEGGGKSTNLYSNADFTILLSATRSAQCLWLGGGWKVVHKEKEGGERRNKGENV